VTVTNPAGDQSREAPLRGLKVLVLEDSYIQADSASRALRAAGAEVIGPCPEPAAALALLKAQAVHCAVLDINLGDGPDYALARRFRAEGMSIVLLTGYSTEILPEDFADFPLVGKPAAEGRLVAAVEAACLGALSALGRRT
jgi:DNA-binding response OmpR family regulator